MNLFDAVKAAVTTKMAAEHYGIKTDKHGKTCCLFHDDKHPSMKLDERFHCFSCGADGDVIDFAARLFGLSSKEAAERLAVDFNVFFDQSFDLAKKQQPRAKMSVIQRLKTYQDENYRVLCGYYQLLQQWKKQYAPKTADEEWHPRFIEAIQNSARVEYLLDELQACSPEKAREFIARWKNEIGQYAKSVRAVHVEAKRAVRDLSR